MVYELSDKELEQVSGGMRGYEITEMRYDFTAGDTFRLENDGPRRNS